jgi:Fe-S-cluster-containing dehydrogenase component/CRP-like cAMP-binding protein
MAVALESAPQRWDSPFDPDMTDEEVYDLLNTSAFMTVDRDLFPTHTPFEGILKNDTRIVNFHAGDIVVREGDYGNSAFIVLEGSLRVFVGNEGPEGLLGRQSIKKRGVFSALSQLFSNSHIPEVRDTRNYGTQNLREGRQDSDAARVFVQDIPAVLDEFRTAILEEGAVFGELAALGRIPRTATIFSETDSVLLEIRWQGLRELRKYNEEFRRQIDTRYRENALKVHLRETPLFTGLEDDVLEQLVSATLFETYGAFDWHISYQKMRSSGRSGPEHEVPIASEGEYADGLLLIRAGFARVSVNYGKSNRTVAYLGAGQHYGLRALYDSWKSGTDVALGSSLTALGYVDVLRVPAPILEEHVFPNISGRPPTFVSLDDRSVSDDSLLEWSVEERFINGTQAMLIDLNRCVRCDDCVRACASTHGGNPRFVRHGKTFDHWMVANACMHCADPVCMIGCPTGAIHRSQVGGMVIINDDTCIGCGTCANSCPYNNIRLVDVRSRDGSLVLNPNTQLPIQKATKCDLCATNPGGPACVRACPHGALSRVDFQPETLAEDSP